ncbi:hypothetical protein GS3922_09765 [Geobacillus subterraneus]|uniref:Uncharacterized protein n=1 Tax=Geobacillus subterraneus TaxID=129338 RepID=A0ABM6ACC4_9BACL|nr:hypothetical protein GS3922_09765 [Geobacillus subterraneus]
MFFTVFREGRQVNEQGSAVLSFFKRRNVADVDRFAAGMMDSDAQCEKSCPAFHAGQLLLL